MLAPRIVKFTAPSIGEHEVSIPEEFLHKDEVAEGFTPKSEFKAELDRRVQGVIKDLRKPEDLLKDDDFLTKIADARKSDLIKILGITPAAGAPDIEKIRGEITQTLTKDKIEPLVGQLKVATEEIDILRVRDRDSQTVSQAARLGVVDDLLSLVTLYVAQKVGWDPERKSWFAKKEEGDGFEFSSDPKRGGSTYKGIAELMEDLAADDSKKAWFKTTVQDGGSFNGSKGDPKGVTAEAYGKMSPADKTKWAAQNPDHFARIMREQQSAGEQKLLARR